MKTDRQTPLVPLALATLLALGAAATAEDEPDLAQNNAAFALDLYGQLSQEEGNVFFSPSSISTALAMTYAGARGRTADQMAEVLHFHLPPGELPGAFAALAKREAPGEGYTLRTANALWGQTGYEFLKPFLETNRRAFGAGLREVDFKGDPAAARQTINRWVEEQTGDKIRELIKAGILTPLTRLVLTNAVHFKGSWAAEFEPKNTTPAPFHGPGGSVQAALMFQRSKLPYAEAPGVQVLGLPYAGEHLSMVVVLPRERDGLPALERSLTHTKLNGWITALRPRQVNVHLPRFETTCEFRLDKALKALGMTDAFGPSSDFSGMNGERDLYVQAVVHKAFVDVNEEGTEAAAATAVVVGKRSAASRPLVFRADHPFLFLIRDDRTGSILFLGRLVKP